MGCAPVATHQRSTRRHTMRERARKQLRICCVEGRVKNNSNVHHDVDEIGILTMEGS
jgi:hypothetical protein